MSAQGWRLGQGSLLRVVSWNIDSTKVGRATRASSVMDNLEEVFRDPSSPPVFMLHTDLICSRSNWNMICSGLCRDCGLMINWFAVKRRNLINQLTQSALKNESQLVVRYDLLNQSSF